MTLVAENVKRQLRLVERAQRDATDELPATKDKTLSGAQSDVVEYCQSALREVEVKARNAIQQAAEKATEKLASGSDPRALRLTFEAEVETLIRANAEELEHMGIEAIRSRRDYLLFRRKHQRDYEPDYPSSVFVQVSILLFMAVLEAGANAFFFAQASSIGFTGGFFTAASISVVNVALGFLTGLVPLRYLRHHSKWFLVPSFVLLIVMFVANVWFNLVVAHYREVLTFDPDAALRSVLATNPAVLLQFRSLESMVLFAIGFMIFLGATYEGYHIFGSYPGYRRRHVRFANAEADFVELKEHVREDVQAKYAATSQAFTAAIEDARKQSTMLAQATTKLVGYLAHIDDERQSIEDVCNQLLAAYREENRAVRQTPPPSYFNGVVALRKADLTGEIEAHRAHFETLRQEIERRVDAMGHTCEGLQEHLKTKMGELDTLAQRAEGKAREKTTSEEQELAP